MKIKFAYLLLCSFSVLTALAKDVIIKGKINGKLPETLYYTAPINGVLGFDLCYTAPVDAKGNFEIKADIDGVSFIDIFYNYQPAGYLVVTPGGKYDIIITEAQGKVTHKITGGDAQLQSLYAKLINNNKEDSFFSLAADASKIEDPTVFKSYFEKKSKADLDMIASHFNNKSINQGLMTALSQDREYFYASVTSYAILLKYLNALDETSTSNPEPFNSIWADIYSKDAPGITKSSWCAYYLQGYKNYKAFQFAGFNAKNVANAPDALSDLKHNVSLLPKQYIEHFIAIELYSYTAGNRKEKGAITIFNYLKQQYPNSGYIKYFEPKVAVVAAFFSASESLPQGAAFVDDYAKVNTFEELVKKFPGKKLYFDVWATWCGPCREEFKYKDALYKLLKANDITIIYISVDKDDKDETWKKMIGHYNLQGFHVRTSQTFSTNLATLFHNGNKNDGGLLIPWYILVNADGTTAALHAAPPSELSKLEADIKKM